MFKQFDTPQPIGKVLKNSFSLFKDMYVKALALSVIMGLTVWELGGPTIKSIIKGEFGVGFARIVVLEIILFASFYMLLDVAHTFATNKSRALIGTVKHVASKVIPLFLFGVVLFLISLIEAIPALFSAFVFSGGVAGSEMQYVYSLFSLAGTVLFSLLSLYLFVKALLMPAYIIFENKSALDALKSSFSVTQKNWWRTALTLFVGYLVVSLPVLIMAFIMTYSLSGSVDEATLLQNVRITSGITVGITYGLFISFPVAVYTNLFNDLNLRQAK